MITIIILLILAGITISQLTQNGIFDKSKESTEKYQNEQQKEETKISEYNQKIDIYVTGNRDTVILTQEQYKNLTDKIDALEARVQNIEDLELDYDNKVDIKSYKSSTNTYTVPSNGIIIASAESTANGLTKVYVNNIAINICGRAATAWNNGGYSQLVNTGNVIYFYVESGSSLERAYFIPFK